MRPAVSVIMPVLNAAPYLPKAIESILDQSFADLELIVVDDGSDDGSPEIAAGYARRDRRVRHIALQRDPRTTSGARASNVGIGIAQGDYIARMDADDISCPERLQPQQQIIQDHEDVVAVGTLCEGIDSHGRAVRPRDRWRIVRRSSYVPFPHGSVMFRKEAFDEMGGYREGFRGGEDQDLFFRMTAKGRVVTLPDALYRYRYHLDNATLHNGAHGMREKSSQNAQALAAFYMLGAMRLWAGYPPMILRPMLSEQSLKWNYQRQ